MTARNIRLLCAKLLRMDQKYIDACRFISHYGDVPFAKVHRICLDVELERRDGRT